MSVCPSVRCHTLKYFDTCGVFISLFVSSPSVMPAWKIVFLLSLMAELDMSEAALQKFVAANPVAAPVEGEPAKHTKHMCHPFVDYDQAPAQVGDDDGSSSGPRQRRR